MEVAESVTADETTVTSVVSVHVVVGAEPGSWLASPVTELETGAVLVLPVTIGIVVSSSQAESDDNGTRVVLNVGNGGETEVTPEVTPGDPVPRLVDAVDIEEAPLGLPDTPVAPGRLVVEFVIGNRGELDEGGAVTVLMPVLRPEGSGTLPVGGGTTVEFDKGKGGDDVDGLAGLLWPEPVIVPVPVAPTSVLLEFVKGKGGIEDVTPRLAVTVPLGKTADVELDRGNGAVVAVPANDVLPELTVCPEGPPVSVELKVGNGGDGEVVAEAEGEEPPETLGGEVPVGPREVVVLFASGNGAEPDPELEGGGEPEDGSMVVGGAAVEKAVEDDVEFTSGKGTDDDDDEVCDPTPDDAAVPDGLAVENVVFGDEEVAEVGSAELECTVPVPRLCVVFVSTLVESGAVVGRTEELATESAEVGYE